MINNTSVNYSNLYYVPIYNDSIYSDSIYNQSLYINENYKNYHYFYGLLPVIYDNNFINYDELYCFLLFGLLYKFLLNLLDTEWIKKNIDKNQKNKNKVFNNKSKKIETNNKKKVGLLTNEIPPIVYGGVSTWITNFIKMFEDDEKYEIIPIYLEHLDKPHNSFKENYPNIRILNQNNMKEVFKDIDVVINNLWICYDLIREIKQEYNKLLMISVCHSIIKMEHLTNMESAKTNNFYEQEITFQYSDIVVLISKSEKKHYNKLGYDKYNARQFVIYNSYKPKFDSTENTNDYNNNNLGYIGRHVPRKRPELPLKGLLHLKNNNNENDNYKNIKIKNMGINKDNEYWINLQENYKELLETIEFNTDKSVIDKYWSNIGVNCITGIYEPFGYTMCETLDRKIPAIVPNIEGPSEIVEDFKDCVFEYDVSMDFEEDIQNFSKAINKFLNTKPEVRKQMAEKARGALDNFRPDNIKQKWKSVIENRELRDDIEFNNNNNNSLYNKFGSDYLL